MELAAEATRVGHLVLGIGVNLNVPREAFPEEFRASATSLAAELGRPVARADFARRLFGTLEDVLDIHAERGFAALRPRWDRFYRMAGRAVVVSEPGGPRLEGVALEAEADGALAVRRSDGTVDPRAGGRRDARAPRRSGRVSDSVLLAVDVGNTNVLFGAVRLRRGEGHCSRSTGASPPGASRPPTSSASWCARSSSSPGARSAR